MPPIEEDGVSSLSLSLSLSRSLERRRALSHKKGAFYLSEKSFLFLSLFLSRSLLFHRREASLSIQKRRRSLFLVTGEKFSPSQGEEGEGLSPFLLREESPLFWSEVRIFLSFHIRGDFCLCRRGSLSCLTCGEREREKRALPWKDRERERERHLHRERERDRARALVSHPLCEGEELSLSLSLSRSRFFSLSLSLSPP